MVSTVVGQCVFPPNDSYGLVCDEARFLCGYEMDGFTGRLLSEKSPTPQPHPLCSGAGEADNIQWFSFVADDVNVEIVIRYSNCTGNILSPGLQVGIFESCELNNEGEPLGSIYCVEDINYVDIVLTPDPMDIEIGQLYLLFVDGYAGSACDFEIDVIQGVCTDPPIQSQDCEQDCGVISLIPGNEGCTLFQDNFSFSPSSQIIADVFGCNPDVNNTRLDSIICIEWDIQPSTGFNFISSSFNFFDSLGVTSTLTVEWTAPGTYSIKPILTINPLFSACQSMCDCSDNVVYTIDISESTLVFLPEIELCPGDCIDFCGQTYCATGDYVCYNRDECIIETQTIVERPNIEVDEGLFFFCPGECFEYQNVSYCSADNYEVMDSAACDTTFLFQLEELSLSIDLVQADDLINCFISQAFLEGGYITNFNGNINSAWISESGDTLSFGNEYVATDAGNYTFVAWPENMKECEISISHLVEKDDAIPTASLSPPLLNCNNPSDIITLNTLDDILTAEWIGPNGFTSNEINPQVNGGGTYEVTITSTNGCKLIINTEVVGDFEVPDIAVFYDDLTCSENIPIAEFTSLTTIVSNQWSLPDGSVTSDDILNLNDAGNYSLEVTALNGCTNTFDFTVMDLSYDPSLQLSEDRIWRCNDTEETVDLSSQEIPGLKYFWTNIEGATLSNTINLTITSPGVYILTILDESTECIGRDTVRIDEDTNPFLDINLSMLPPVCEGGNDGSIDTYLLVGGEKPFNFEINGESYLESEIGTIDFEAGTYTLNVTDAFGCLVTKEFDIPASEMFTVTREPELSIRFGQSKTITFETSLDESEIGLIEWTNEEGDILGLEKELVFVGEPTKFIYLRVENLDGCEVVSQIRINLSFDVDIYYPNVFSPNNDGNNDLFVLYNNGYPETADDLKIFDRYGALIYKSSHTAFNENLAGWDGTFNGQPCQPGVYVFMLEYTLMDGTSKSLAGSITLVR